MSDAIERWVPVDGWEDFYEVSDWARVRGLDRLVPRNGRVVFVRGQILAQPPDSHGYHRVNLCRGGKYVTRKVHVLVAEAFIGPCPEGEEVRHGPNGQHDNTPANLSYGTRSQNNEDKIRDGTHLYGSRVGWAKLTEGAVRECRARYSTGGATFRSLADEFGVGIATMHHAVTGKQWKHVA